jgi:hypothetical protein
MKVKFNPSARIGQVIFVVEGDQTEHELIEHVFADLLKYECVHHYRNKGAKYKNPRNQYGFVSVISAEKSCISSVKSGQGYLNAIYKEMIDSYKLRPDSASIYYLFDRDRSSNTKPKVIRDLITEFSSSSGEADATESQGLLLISYPSLESAVLSAIPRIDIPAGFVSAQDLKTFIQNKHIKLGMITQNGLKFAAKAFYDSFKQILKSPFQTDSLDSFSLINEQIFDAEENIYHVSSRYIFLSLFILSLVDLKILSFS